MDNSENVSSFSRRGRKKAAEKKQYFMLKEGVLQSIDGHPVTNANRGCLHLVLGIDGDIYSSNDGKFHKNQIILVNHE